MFSGATRRDRTGDLLITKFRVSVYAVDLVFGGCPCGLAVSARSALIEPDFEPNFRMLISPVLERSLCRISCLS